MPTFASWHANHFSSSLSPCRWVRSWLSCFPDLVWVIIQTLTTLTKTGTPLSPWLVGRIVSPVYVHHPMMNFSRFNPIRCQKSDNTSLFLYCRILQYQRQDVPNTHHVNWTKDTIAYCCLALSAGPAHAHNHSGHYIRVPRPLTTFSQSGIFKFETVALFNDSYSFIWTPLITMGKTIFFFFFVHILHIKIFL